MLFQTKMNYLHIAIIEDTNECLVSFTETGLRGQVTGSLINRGIDALNDEEWADCVKGEVNCDRTTDCLPFGTIYYYKTESKLGDMAAVNGARE
jgi:hypothetical protein